jgi:hypothetical protein
MIKTHNHFVPNNYLQHWTNNERKIMTYRTLVPHKNEREWKPHSPKSIGFHEHLYTQLAAGGETDVIETWFEKSFETPAAPALKRAVNDQSLSREDWRMLVRFLAAQDVRTPARMLERFKHWNEIMPSLLKDTLTGAVHDLQIAKKAGIGLPEAYPVQEKESFPARTFVQIDPDADEGFIHVEATIGRGLWLWSLKHLLTVTLTALHEHRWTILRSPPSIDWLTSDDPVIRLNYQDPCNYDFKGGWGSQGTEIMLPLSPKHLMYTQIGAKTQPPRGTVMSLEFASQVQKFTVEHAHRYIFSRFIDPQVSMLRPRIVDLENFYAERAQWQTWNKKQSEAERTLLERR